MSRRRAPSWVRGEQPDLGEDAAAKLRDEVARDQLHLRVVGSLPLDRATAQRELTDEQRAMRGSRPTTRRWKAVTRLDDAIAKLEARHAEAVARLRGKRPEPTLYERERERNAAKLLVEAAALEIDRALERRLQHIETNRPSMFKEAQKALGEAEARIVEHLRAAPARREAALAARADLLWAAFYPDQPESFGFPTAAALGLQEPVRRILGSKAMYQHEQLVRLLEEDANRSRTRSATTRSGGWGSTFPARSRTAPSGSFDSNDEDLAEWKREQLERARRLAECGDPHRLAAEVREDRP